MKSYLDTENHIFEEYLMSQEDAPDKISGFKKSRL